MDGKKTFYVKCSVIVMLILSLAPLQAMEAPAQKVQAQNKLSSLIKTKLEEKFNEMAKDQNSFWGVDFKLVENKETKVPRDIRQLVIDYVSYNPVFEEQQTNILVALFFLKKYFSAWYANDNAILEALLESGRYLYVGFMSHQAIEKREVIKKLKKYKKLISDQMDIKELILFGSYAAGTAGTDSDIDVAVVVDNIEGGFLQEIKKTGIVIR